MEAKKRMSNKAFGRLWYTLLALLLIVTLVANYFAMKYTTIITRSLGHTTTKVITTADSAGDSQYFKSDYANHDELVAHQTEFSKQLVAEGIVLMRNEDHVLPLESGKKISLFGIGSAKFLYGGLGSGAIDTSKCMSLKDALEAEGFQVNPTLYKAYADSKAKVGKEESPSLHWAGWKSLPISRAASGSVIRGRRAFPLLQRRSPANLTRPAGWWIPMPMML